MRIAAKMPRTAIVSNSSTSVRPARAGGIGRSPARGGLVQRRRFDRSPIRGLHSAAAEQFVLLLQQLLDFSQLANLVGTLLNGIGKRRLRRLRSRSQRAVKP